MKPQKKFARIVVAIVLLAVVALISIWGYSEGQLRHLADQQQSYLSPEDGMRSLVATWYSDVERVEIVATGEEVTV